MSIKNTSMYIFKIILLSVLLLILLQASPAIIISSDALPPLKGRNESGLPEGVHVIPMERGRLMVEPLECGATLLAIEIPDAPVCHGMIAVKVGGRYEADEYAGISHLLEHLVIRKGKDSASLAKIREAGGSVNAVTDFEMTSYYFTVLPEFFTDSIAALADMVLSPGFDEQDLRSERKVVMEELGAHTNDPRLAVLPALIRKVFPSSPLTNLVIGNKKSVSRITLQDLYRFHRTYYTPSNLIVAGAGNINGMDMLVSMRALLSDMEKKEPPLHTFGPPETALHTLYRKIPVRQSFHIYGAVVPGINSESYPAMEMLSVLLGSGVNSRMHRRLVVQDGFTNQLYQYWFSLSDTGVWAVFISLNPEDSAQARAAAAEEIRRVTAGDYSDRELQNARDALLAETLIRLDKPWDLLNFEVENLAFRGEIATIPEYTAQIREVDRADISQVARSFSEENLITIFLEPARGPGRIYITLKYLLTGEL